MNAEREMNLDEWVGSLYEGHLARVELARLRSDLAEAREELARRHAERVRDIDIHTAELAEARAEVEKLRADVVWAVKQGAVSWRNNMLTYSQAAVPIPYIRHDGTDASLLSAVRRAREGSTDGD